MPALAAFIRASTNTLELRSDIAMAIGLTTFAAIVFRVELITMLVLMAFSLLFTYGLAASDIICVSAVVSSLSASGML